MRNYTRTLLHSPYIIQTSIVIYPLRTRVPRKAEETVVPVVFRNLFRD